MPQYLSSHNNISYEILIKCPCCAAVPHRSRGRLSDIELHHPASVGAAARTPLAYDIWTRTNTIVKGIAKACQTRLVYIRPYLHSELHTLAILYLTIEQLQVSSPALELPCNSVHIGLADRPTCSILDAPGFIPSMWLRSATSIQPRRGLFLDLVGCSSPTVDHLCRPSPATGDWTRSACQ